MNSTVTEPRTFNIPKVGECPAFTLRSDNKGMIRNLITRAESYFNLAAKAWVDANDGSKSEAYRRSISDRETKMAGRAEALLTPLGIEIDYPGLYPSFKVNGYGYHTTESAVIAALDLPQNFLRS